MTENKISLHDTSLSVWEQKVDQESMRRRVFMPAVTFMRRRGWEVKPCPETAKRYGVSFGKNYYAGTKGEMHCLVELSGRHFKVEIWQEKYNRDNPNGGRYDFDKRKRMPYLLGRRCDLEIIRLRDFLIKKTGYEFEDRNTPPMQLADDFLAKRYAECSHTKKELDRPDWHYDSNRKSADGALLEHGQTVWFYHYSGRLMRGQAFYNLNMMWWVKFSPFEVTNRACWELFAVAPDDIRAKSQRLRRSRLEACMTGAIKRMDFTRAEVLKKLLFGDSPLYRIYSEKQGAYYGPDRCGYYGRSDAGLYTLDEAEKACRGISYLKIEPVYKGEAVR